MIDVNCIRVVNSRNRESKKYKEIVNSIQNLGLKTPIVVSEREIIDGKQFYDLVCGEGRLNAYKQSNEQMIPARILNVGTEDLLLMSLVENIARRQPNKTAIIKEIERLIKEGYSIGDIAQKTGYTTNYIARLKTLVDKGEKQIINAVLSGKMPISIAITIVECSNDESIQNYLNKAYEDGEININSLKYMKEVLWRRKNGNKWRYKSKDKDESIIAECKAEIKRGTTFLRKVQRCENNLAYLKGALMKILEDDCFVDLMLTQGINNIPEQIQK